MHDSAAKIAAAGMCKVLKFSSCRPRVSRPRYLYGLCFAPQVGYHFFTRMNKQHLEHLEPRTLFAGVTLLTHGWNGTLGGSTSKTADAISARLGGNSQVPRYVLQIGPETGS